MDYRPTVIERAFALAESGHVNSVSEIRDALKAEGYSVAGQLYGSSIMQQLGKLIAMAKAKGG